MKRLPFRAFKELQELIQADFRENIKLYGHVVVDLKKNAGELILADFQAFFEEFKPDFEVVLNYVHRSVLEVYNSESQTPWTGIIGEPVVEAIAWGYLYKFLKSLVVPKDSIPEWRAAIIRHKEEVEKNTEVEKARIQKEKEEEEKRQKREAEKERREREKEVASSISFTKFLNEVIDDDRCILKYLLRDS